jgi:hypothetical protein
MQHLFVQERFLKAIPVVKQITTKRQQSKDKIRQDHPLHFHWTSVVSSWQPTIGYKPTRLTVPWCQSIWCTGIVPCKKGRVTMLSKEVKWIMVLMTDIVNNAKGTWHLWLPHITLCRARWTEVVAAVAKNAMADIWIHFKNGLYNP